jgi:hypothetical protein
MTPQPAAESFSDRRLVTAYEELRSQAVQGWQRGSGLTLLLTRGFRCWMETSCYWLETPPTKPACLDQPAQSLPSGLRSEVVVLLASMLLHRVSKGIP